MPRRSVDMENTAPIPVVDVEKGRDDVVAQPSLEGSSGSSTTRQRTTNGFLHRLEKQMIIYNFEARGIRRVEPDERHPLKTLGYQQIGLLWFSINLAANNITLGMLGPAVFGLNFLDASLCGVFGMLVGCLPVGYIAAFGPVSGSRSLVVARYAMGWWPAKIIVVLNIVVLLGYVSRHVDAL